MDITYLVLAAFFLALGSVVAKGLISGMHFADTAPPVPSWLREDVGLPSERPTLPEAWDLRWHRLCECPPRPERSINR
jgi:hypothetical protein